MIAQHLLTGPRGTYALGPIWQGLRTVRGYKPSWCLSPAGDGNEGSYLAEIVAMGCYF